MRDEITEAKLFRSPTSFKNSDPDKNYTGGVCKTFIDLLGKKETKKEFKNATRKLNHEIEL